MKKYLLFIFFVFFIPQVACLQTKVEDQLSVDFSNDFPGPNEEISVYIESYQTDLNRANIGWILNGTLIKQGLGLKDFVFSAGNLGEETVLTIRVTKQGGGTFEKKYYVNPGEIDLYYEANTYIPPFYKGRPEFSLHSDLKLVALPNLVNSSGQKISDKNISYAWKINGVVDQRNSGAGKNVFYYSPGIIPKPIQVIVEASPINSNQSAKVVKVIEPVYPSVSVYEKNPIYGTIFEQTIKDGSVLSREEIEIVAVPYNFSQDIFSVGVFEWKLNNKKISGFDSNKITFRKTDEGSINSRISVEIEHPKNILQTAKNVFNLSFSDSDNNFNF